MAAHQRSSQDRQPQAGMPLTAALRRLCPQAGPAISAESARGGAPFVPRTHSSFCVQTALLHVTPTHPWETGPSSFCYRCMR